MSVLVTQLRSDLTAAMRAGEKATVKVLRTALSAIANAEALGVSDQTTGSSQSSGRIAGATGGVGSTDAERRDLSEDDVREVISSERDERIQAADAMAAAGASEAASRLREEAAALDRYLRTGPGAGV